MKSLSELHDCDWIPIVKKPYILKYKATESGYIILVTDLKSVYGEELEATDVKKRFNELNELADMKSNLIMKNIIDSLQELQEDKGNHGLTIEQSKVIITLDFSTKYTNLKYEMKLEVLPGEELMNFIVAPTIISALLSKKKVEELEKKMQYMEQEGLKASSAVTIANPVTAIDPTWFKGKAPPEFVVKSFVKLQLHFNSLKKENSQSYHSRSEVNICGDSCILRQGAKETPDLKSFIMPIQYQDEDKKSAPNGYIDEIKHEHLSCDQNEKSSGNLNNQEAVSEHQVKIEGGATKIPHTSIVDPVPKKTKKFKF